MGKTRSSNYKRELTDTDRTKRVDGVRAYVAIHGTKLKTGYKNSSEVSRLLSDGEKTREHTSAVVAEDGKKTRSRVDAVDGKLDKVHEKLDTVLDKLDPTERARSARLAKSMNALHKATQAKITKATAACGALKRATSAKKAKPANVLGDLREAARNACDEAVEAIGVFEVEFPAETQLAHLLRVAANDIGTPASSSTS